MNTIKKKYKEKYGDLEPYIALKLQMNIIATLLIAILGTFLNPLIHSLQALTFAVLVYLLIEIKSRYKEKLKRYIAVFITLYIAVAAVPVLVSRYSLPISPQGINLMLMAVVGLLVLFIALRALTSRTGVKAKVVLANEEIAVIQPEYNLLSGIKPKKYVVENKGAKEQDQIVVSISKTPFKQPKPKKIKEVIT